MRSSLRVTVRERVREVEEKGEGERMTGGSSPVHVGKKLPGKRGVGLDQLGGTELSGLAPLN